MSKKNNIDEFYTPDVHAYSAAYFEYVSKVLNKISADEIDEVISLLLEAREKEASIYFIGNGGSASTASHFANDLSIGTKASKKPFQAISLTDNIAILTALGNDFGYEDIFVRQLKILAKPGDVLIAISCSGNSPNIVKAIEWANDANMKTLAISAFDGGQIKQMAHLNLHVPTLAGEYGPAEDAHLALNHLIGSYLMRRISNE